MSIDLTNPMTIVKGIAAFGLVIAVWSAVLVLVARRRSARDALIHQRLDPGGGPVAGARTLRLWHEGEEAVTVVSGESDALTLMQRLERMRRDAGFRMPLRNLLSAMAGGMIFTAVTMAIVTHRTVPSLVGPLIIVIVLWWQASRRAAKRRILFDRQFVDSLELCARALRAGHPLLSAFKLMSEEIPAPVGLMFAEICQQQAMGVRLEDGLLAAANQSGSPDMKLFSASLSINMKSGGQVADVMEGIAFVIRERQRLGRRFRTLTAQTQFSKRILVGLPFVLFGVLNVISPEYIGHLYMDTTGQTLLGASLASLLIGWIVMNKMSDLKV